MPVQLSLPIDEVLPEIRSQLQQHNNLVLQAPPGAGKTTRVPLALLDAGWLQNRSIIMLEPRRLAVRAAATRMADLLAEAVGQRVGYQIRFERKSSPQTRIEVVTEGILTRRLQTDPALENVGLVIFDEYHERSLQADLGLALCLDSQAALREDLRILVMSATLDEAAVAGLLGNAPVITSAGRSYPVEMHYLQRDPEPQTPIPLTVVRAIQTALNEQHGDMLVFLPGSGEIRRTQELLDQQLSEDTVSILPLYGDLAFADQQRALQADARQRRRIILATPIAETSLTIEGIRIVIDSGWTRIPRFDPVSGLSKLVTVRISADSAEQRSGRAGRLGAGVCYRLWIESTQRRLAAQRPPEIEQADLAPLALELAQWGVRDRQDLAWLTMPPVGALAQARELLIDLGALDEHYRITESGRKIAELPLHPRLAHMLLASVELGCVSLACDLAALLEERDILRGKTRDSDIVLRLESLQAFRANVKTVQMLDSNACQRVERAARQWRRRLRVKEDNTACHTDDVGLLLALAYPERIAKKRDNFSHRYQLANGRGARLREDDPLSNQDWLVAAQVDAGDRSSGAEGKIFLAAALNRQTLADQLSGRIRHEQNIDWDDEQAAVIALEEQRLGVLSLSSRTLSNPDPELIKRAMLNGIRRLGLDCLPWNDQLRQWQQRALSVRQWFPEEDWPDVSDTALLDTLEQWLAPYLTGISRRQHLAQLDLANILRHSLDWSRQTRLDELAPTHLQVPSGSRLRLSYRAGETPVLAVKLQEMFGLSDTPRIANGRIAVMLHLLSPAQRPVQITQDLKGFWQTTYAEVKKELKGRYPKHPWPDDPWSATPTRRTNRQTARQHSSP